MTTQTPLAATSDCVAQPFLMRRSSAETKYATNSLKALVKISDALKLILIVSLIICAAEYRYRIVSLSIPKS